MLPGGEGAEVGVLPGGSRRIIKLLKKKKNNQLPLGTIGSQNLFGSVHQPRNSRVPPPRDSGATQRRRAARSPRSPGSGGGMNKR